MKKLNIQEGQNLFDIVLQEFGSLENIGNFLANNPSVGVNDDFISGQEVLIESNNLGDENIKSKFVRTNFVTNNKDSNFIASTQDQKQFQNGDAFNFQNGDAFEYN